LQHRGSVDGQIGGWTQASLLLLDPRELGDDGKRPADALESRPSAFLIADGAHERVALRDHGIERVTRLLPLPRAYRRFSQASICVFPARQGSVKRSLSRRARRVNGGCLRVERSQKFASSSEADARFE
jgi:hypothetical protein